eukprot:4562054-Pleurochrysis_carterae.AAC.1
MGHYISPHTRHDGCMTLRTATYRPVRSPAARRRATTCAIARDGWRSMAAAARAGVSTPAHHPPGQHTVEGYALHREGWSL